MVLQQTLKPWNTLYCSFRNKAKLTVSATVFSRRVEEQWTVTAVPVCGDCWGSSILTAQREKRFRATEISFCKSNSVCLIQDSRWLSCHFYNLEFLNYINWAAEERCIKTCMEPWPGSSFDFPPSSFSVCQCVCTFNWLFSLLPWSKLFIFKIDDKCRRWEKVACFFRSHHFWNTWISKISRVIPLLGR